MGKIEYAAQGGVMPNPSVFDGDSSIALVEPSGAMIPSNSLVDSSKEFSVKVTWSQDGNVSEALDDLSGMWTVELIYDRLGGSSTEEGSLPVTSNPATLAAKGGKDSYEVVFTVAPNTLTPGAYTLAALISGEAGPFGFYGFEEIRPFRVY